jgi:DNA-binding transcriptional LysR family regulator
MRGLNLDHLQAFAEVVRLGSFSAAAARLNLTQPAISQQVGQLEKKLGVKLVERMGRRAMPTAAGAELLEHTARLDGAVAATLESLARFARGEVGRVRLGTGATAAIFRLPPMLRSLRRKLPELEITIATGNTSDVVKAVQDNALDVALVTLPVSGRNLEITPVLDDEFVAVTASDGVKLPARVTPAALARLPVIMFEPGGQTRLVTDQWFFQGGVELKPKMALGSVEAIKRLVGAGLGCAVLPKVAVQEPGDRRSLVVRPLSPRLYRKLAIVVRRDKVLQRGLRETIKALRELRPTAP